jgi:Tol biopolymer transport system component
MRQLVVTVAAAMSVLLVHAGLAAAAPPANDAFASAVPLAPQSGGTWNGSNVDATKEPGEPDHAGNTGGASVWFRWTPSFDGSASVDTTGSGFDTLLAVYTGTSLGGLTLVGSNDDVGDVGSISRVCFTAHAGAPVFIAVDGYLGDAGSATLHWGVKSDAAPCPTTPPQITAGVAPTVGERLTATTGTFADPGSLSEQWLSCAGIVCDAIPDATGPSYTLTSRDVGTSIVLDVSSTGAGIIARNQSAPTAVVGMPASTHEDGRIFWVSNRIIGNVYHSFLSSMFGDGSHTVEWEGGVGEPALSPEGTLLTGLAAPAGTLTLSFADLQGFVQTALTGRSPTWSPDGSRIAYLDYQNGGVRGINVWDIGAGWAATTRIATFTPGTGALDLRWSPDGRLLAVSFFDFSDQTPNDDIAVLAADGSGPLTLLTSSLENDSAPSWSPTGDQIAFTRGAIQSQAGDADLWLMNADGSNQHKLYNGDETHNVVRSSWSPDGSSIVFSRQDGGLYSGGGHVDLFTIPVTGGAITQLTHGGPGDVNEEPAWAVRASYVLSVGADGSGSGRIVSQPAGISCGTTCDAVFTDPTAVTLSAIPDPGSTFTGWSGDCVGAGACVVPMFGYRGVVATFETAAPPPPLPPAPPSPPPSGRGGGGGGAAGGVPPDLHVDLSSSAAAAAPAGTEVLFFVKVSTTNVGAASAVRLDVTLPAGYVVTKTYADRGSGCTGAAPKLSCDVAWIAPGTNTSVTIWGTIGQAGEQDATATATSLVERELDSTLADNTSTLRLLAPATPPSTGGGTSGSGPAAPKALAPATLSGAARVGRVLRAHAPSWSERPDTIRYQWQLCTTKGCRPIGGATSATLKLTKATAGKSVRVVVIARIGGATAKALSTKVAVRGASHRDA